MYCIANVKNNTIEPGGVQRLFFIPIDAAAYRGDAGCIPQAAWKSTWRNADGSLFFSNWRGEQVIIAT